MHKVEPFILGADANLAAAQLAKTLDQPANFGIGTLPGHSYAPIQPAVLEAGKTFLTTFLGLPAQRVSVIPTKGGGSGAISAGLAALRAMGYRPEGLGFSGWDWSGYESFCAAHGLTKHGLMAGTYQGVGAEVLPLLQTNRNGAGTRLSQTEAEAVVQESNELKRPNFIDLPYFTGTETEKAVLATFTNHATEPTVIAWSPTKIFQTFADRPGGVTLIVWPSAKVAQAHAWLPGAVARGTTGFDDVVTRGLWQAMAEEPEALLSKHQHYLNLIDRATELWRKSAPTEFLPYFDDAEYGGMFRLFPADHQSQARLAEKNIVAVEMQHEGEYRIRVNLCGILNADGTAIANASQILADFFAVLQK